MGRSDSPRLVSGVITRPQAPCRIPPGASALAVTMLVLRAGRETEVHEMGDVGLPFAAVERAHVELLGLAMFRCSLARAAGYTRIH